jgi:predicted nucleic acid-binding Zn ribbon protein
MIERCGNCGEKVDIGGKDCKNCGVNILDYDEWIKTRNLILLIIGIAFIIILFLISQTIFNWLNNMNG